MIFKKCFNGAGPSNINTYIKPLMVSLKVPLDVEENVCREERTNISIERGVSIYISSYYEKNIDGGFVLLEGDLSC